MPKKRLGLILIVALVICGGAFAYTYTTGFLTINVGEPSGNIATLTPAAGQPDWDSLTTGDITVCGEVPIGDLYVVAPNSDYTGDLVVKVFLPNTSSLIKAYQYLNMKLYLEGSVEAGETPNYRILTLNNAVATFNLESPFGVGGGSSPETWTQTSQADFEAGTLVNLDTTASPGDVMLESGIPSDWYNASWQYRKKITIDHTRVTAGLTNFPVLINLSADADLANDAQNDGDDILFTAANGTTKLSHEIERFDDATGELLAWIKVPSLAADTDTDIYIYYGNALAGNQQDTENVWDSNFKGTWHLTEDGNGTAGEFKDSTSNDNDGQGGGGVARRVPAKTTGKIGDGQDFDGANNGDYIDCGDDISLDITDEITVEAWVNHRSGDSGGHIVNRGGGWSEPGYSLFWYGDNMRIELQKSGEKTSCDNPAPSNNEWHHVAFTWDATSKTIRTYIDGTQASTTKTFNGPIGISQYNLMIGRYEGRGSWHFGGIIDEARVSNTARSEDWIKTEYNNQSSPATFCSVGAEEMKIVSYKTWGSLTSSAHDTGGTNSFSTISFTISEPGGTDIKFQLRTAATQGGLSSATWYGPTGTGDYYTSSGSATNSVHDGDRWVQYKAYFTGPGDSTPTLSDVSLTYIPGGGPSGNYTLAVTGGSYCLISDDTSDWGGGWSVIPEIYCEVTQR